MFSAEFVAGAICGVLTVLSSIVLLFFQLGRPMPKASSEQSALLLKHRDMVSQQSYHQRDIPSYLQPYVAGEDVETSAWLDIIMHRLWKDFTERASPASFVDFVNRKLTALEIPEFVGDVVCNDFSFGGIVPVVKQIKVLSWKDERPIQIECMVHYSGDAHLAVHTELRLNLLDKQIATLPIELGVSGIEFDMNLLISLKPSVVRPVVTVSVLEDPFVDFQVHSEFGSKTKLKDPHGLRRIFIKGVILAIRRELLLPHGKTFALSGIDIDAVMNGPSR